MSSLLQHHLWTRLTLLIPLLLFPETKIHLEGVCFWVVWSVPLICMHDRSECSQQLHEVGSLIIPFYKAEAETQ